MATDKHCAPTVCKALYHTFGIRGGIRLKFEGWGGTRMEVGCTVALRDFKVVGAVRVQVHKPGNLSLSGYPE